jgi:hypothetical protein
MEQINLADVDQLGRRGPADGPWSVGALTYRNSTGRRRTLAYFMGIHELEKKKETLVPTSKIALHAAH